MQHPAYVQTLSFENEHFFGQILTWSWLQDRKYFKNVILKPCSIESFLRDLNKLTILKMHFFRSNIDPQLSGEPKMSRKLSFWNYALSNPFFVIWINWPFWKWTFFGQILTLSRLENQKSQENCHFKTMLYQILFSRFE